MSAIEDYYLYKFISKSCIFLHLTFFIYFKPKLFLLSKIITLPYLLYYNLIMSSYPPSKHHSESKYINARTSKALR